MEMQMKRCFVRLERLDKKVLDRYLRKEDSSVSFESITKKHRKQARGRTHLAKSPSKTVKESPWKDSCKRRRKIRAKPSYCTEAEFGSGNFKENISVKTTFDNLSPLLNEHPKPEVVPNYNGAINGTKKMNGTDKKEFISENFLKDSSNKTADAIIQLKSDVRPSEAFLQNAIQNFPEKMDQGNNNDDFNLGRVKKEVEVVEELSEFSSFKTELKWDEEDKHSDCAPAPVPEFEDEEIEPRDDDEDDRATVVFDRSFNDGTAHFDDVFEKSEEKIQSVTKKFQKKKIPNRKKKTLVKFKRKRSIIGRNLAKVKKLKKKNSEVRGSRKQPAERESDKESNVGEVCGLVKRLHELYRIILQLQKQLPMNSEQSEYFIRTIKAHQENFYKEIKKSEKTIMKGYDKMLSSFGNANTVSVEIGKRTSLSKEDIADVMSQCNIETSGANLQEVGFSQSLRMEKSTKEGLGNIFNHPGKNPAPCSGSEHGTADPVMTLRTQPTQSGQHRPPKSLQRPNNEPNVAKKIETRENHSTEHFLHSPPNSLKVSRPLQNSNQVQWFEISKPRAHFGPRENFPQRTQVPHRDLRFIRFPQQGLRQVNGNQVRPLLSRPMHGHLSNIRAQYGGGGLPIHGGDTSGVNYRFVINNFGEFVQVSDGFVPPAPVMAEPAPRVRIQSLMDVNPFPFGYSQDRTPSQHFPQGQNLCSAPPAVQLATGPHFDRPKHGNAPAQTNRIRNDFSRSTKSSNNFQKPNNFRSKKNSECNVSGASNQTFPKEGQCTLRNLLTNFSGFLQSNAPKQACPVTETTSVESRVLDPTVPQKLTMRNCRLEAGPVLVLRTEGVTPEEGEKPCQWQESTLDASESETLNQTELNSRVYVCAHNGCKNPGVRICKGCLSIIYCSETCQLKHWSLKHKTECHQLKELRG